jgi:glycosyltransferase involved in cell wall biosynthesis
VNDQPLVSVITATYQMGGYVAQTVDSILAQTYPHVEAIVVDDGSTDDTREVLARYADDPRVRVVHQANAGQTVAKNRGLAEAHGAVIGFCDADDLWRPGKLAAQLPRFGDPRVGVVFGDFQFIDGEGAPIDTVRPRVYEGRVSGRLLIDNFVHFPTALVRREAIAAVDGFDPSLSMGIDWDLWLRLSVDWDFVYVPKILVDYRIWSGQMSHRTGERLDNALRIMDRFIAQHPGVVGPAELRHAWSHTFVSRAIWHAREGRRDEAWVDLRRAFRRRPWDKRLWIEGLRTLKP